MEIRSLKTFRQLVAFTVDLRTPVYYVWLSEELLSTKSKEFIKKALIIRLKSCWEQLNNMVLFDRWDIALAIGPAVPNSAILYLPGLWEAAD